MVGPVAAAAGAPPLCADAGAAMSEIAITRADGFMAKLRLGMTIVDRTE